MANPEHLAILKRGVDVWNEWREEHPEAKPDLSGLNLSGAKLHYAKLDNTDFIRANLSETDLSGSNLNNCSLMGVTFTGANISRVSIVNSDLSYSILSYAVLDRSSLNRSNLSETDFDHANLNQTRLTNANLYRASLVGAHLSHADLTDVNLSYAVLGRTHLDDLDMRHVKGLETITHRGPSSIGIDTIIKSHGHIPETFLIKAGIPQSIIEQIPALVGSLSPIDYYSCFISYSSIDQEFTDRLYADLQNKGVRCWFAPHDLRTGQRIRYGIDEAIRQYDKLVLILSKDSIASTWVEFEVEAALDKEKNGSEVLFPIRLDSTVLESSIPWARYLKQTRHIGDFTYWKNHEDYQKAFMRLLRDLKAGA